MSELQNQTTKYVEELLEKAELRLSIWLEIYESAKVQMDNAEVGVNEIKKDLSRFRSELKRREREGLENNISA